MALFSGCGDFVKCSPGKSISSDEFVASNKLYGGSITQFGNSFKKFGWKVTFVDPVDPENFRKAINEIDPTLDITPIGDGDNYKVRVTTELDFTEANEALTEAAIFNDEREGTMYNRVVFEEVNKSDKFKLTLIWEVIF